MEKVWGVSEWVYTSVPVVVDEHAVVWSDYVS